MEYSNETVTLTAKHFEDLICEREHQSDLIRHLYERIGCVKKILQSEYEQTHAYVEYGIASEIADAIGWEPEEKEETDDGQ